MISAVMASPRSVAEVLLRGDPALPCPPMPLSLPASPIMESFWVPPTSESLPAPPINFTLPNVKAETSNLLAWSPPVSRTSSNPDSKSVQRADQCRSLWRLQNSTNFDFLI